MKDADDAGKMRADARKMLKRLEEKLHTDNDLQWLNYIVDRKCWVIVEGISYEQSSSKVAQIGSEKFKGNLCKWQEFWDSFESSIHLNDCLSDVDKFNYLGGIQEEKQSLVSRKFHWRLQTTSLLWIFSRSVMGVVSSATCIHTACSWSVKTERVYVILLRHTCCTLHFGLPIQIRVFLYKKGKGNSWSTRRLLRR